MTADRPMTPLTGVPDTEDVPDGMAVRVFDMPADVDPPVPVASSHWTLEPGADSGDDRHDVPEMWLVATGRGRMTCGGHTMEVAAGDAVAIRGGQPHRLVNTGDTVLGVFSVWWPR